MKQMNRMAEFNVIQSFVACKQIWKRVDPNWWSTLFNLQCQLNTKKIDNFWKNPIQQNIRTKCYNIIYRLCLSFVVRSFKQTVIWLHIFVFLLNWIRSQMFIAIAVLFRFRFWVHSFFGFIVISMKRSA